MKLQTVENTPGLIVRYGVNIMLALAIFAIGKWLAQKTISWISQTIQKRGVDQTASGFMANISDVVAMVLLAVAAMSQLGIPTTSFVAIIYANTDTVITCFNALKGLAGRMGMVALSEYRFGCKA